MHSTSAEGSTGVVVVGAGLAALRTCEQLRAQGFTGELIVLGAEQHLPYDRPPLSKAVLAGTRDETGFGADFAHLQIDFQPRVTATGLQLDARTVHTSKGDVGFDGLVIATGASPIRLPGEGPQHTLRTIDDARSIRAGLTPGTRVVIVGASWIGAEVATAALAKGCEVTCVEAGPVPLNQALGVEIGLRLMPWWQGVALKLETGVVSIGADSIALTDGTDLVADLVVVGIGVRPETGWLTGSGLELDRGVVVDERLAAAEGIVAVGDVAAWQSRRYGCRMRVEHWENASAGAVVAAATLLGPEDTEASGYDPIPYFWSDQFGHKLQYVGHHTAESELVIRTAADSDKWAAAWLDDQRRLMAMLVIDRPRDMLQARRLILSGTHLDADKLADGALPLADLVPSDTSTTRAPASVTAGS